MNRADLESSAAKIIDDMAKAYSLERREIIQALTNPDVQNKISERIVFDRLCEEGKTVPLARKIMGKAMYLGGDVIP